MARAPETVAQDGWSALSEHTLSEHFPLHRACRDGDVEALSALIQQDAVQSHLLLEDTYYGWTPTHWAAYFGKLDCLRTLIEGVAGKRATPADVKTSRFTQTPAHIASFAGHPHCLTWLVQSGADPNAQDYLGETPLHKAVRTGSTDCIAALGNTRASVGLKNNNGQTAAQLANACGYTDIANKLLEVEKQQGIEASQNGSITRSIPAHGLNGGVFPDNEQSALVTNKLINVANGNTHHYTSSNGYYGFQPNGSNGHIGSNGHHVSNGQDDCEMETESPSENEPANHQANMPVVNGVAQKNGMEAMNGSENHALHAAMNGSRDMHSKSNFGAGLQTAKPVQNSGFGLSNGDITLNRGVSQNNVAIGGRKRTREELPLPEMKRRRTEGRMLVADTTDARTPAPVFTPPLPQSPFLNPKKLNTGEAYRQVPALGIGKLSFLSRQDLAAPVSNGRKLETGSSSLLDHCCSMRAEKGYEAVNYETYVTEMHGC